MPKPVRRVPHPNVLAVANLVHLLMRGRLTVRELAEETGLNRCTVERYCAALRNEGAAYICNWKLDDRGAYSIRIYQLGEGVDVAPPNAHDSALNAERVRKWRAAKAAGRRVGPIRLFTREFAYGV